MRIQQSICQQGGIMSTYQSLREPRKDGHSHSKKKLVDSEYLTYNSLLTLAWVVGVLQTIKPGTAFAKLVKYVIVYSVIHTVFRALLLDDGKDGVSKRLSLNEERHEMGVGDRL
jgi:hypothetical protein